MSDALPPVPDPALASALAADLDAADFRSEPLRRLWGEEADDALGRGVREPVLRAIARDIGPLATAGRFFVLGMPQPAPLVDAAFARVGVDGLVALGLARLDGADAVPTALVRPQSFVDADGVGEWWIASDLDELALGTALPADHVLGVGGASRTLAELVVPVPVSRALDLGTGCGIQALLVARHAGEVVATDISERALAFAALNARLNGVTNITFRQGSMFEPVAGEAFDLIVSNPPFVITPRVEGVTAYEYRDGGLVGDALVEAFVRSVADHLTSGGIAQVLGNWESVSSLPVPQSSLPEPQSSLPVPQSSLPEPVEGSKTTPGLTRLESWIDPALDAWVIEREELTPLAYAELWVRDGGTTPREASFGRMLEAWLDDFIARGVTAVGFGYVLLRRPAATIPEPVEGSKPLRRFEKVSQPLAAPGGSLGRALRDGLAAHDALRDGIPHTLVTAPDVTEARHYLPGNDDPSVIELRQGGGFGRTVEADPALAGFVGACDGELSVMQIVSAIADLFEVPLVDLWTDLEPRIRDLVLDGFLVTAP